MSKPKFRRGDIVVYRESKARLLLIDYVQPWEKVFMGKEGEWYYCGSILYLKKTNNPELPLIPVRSTFVSEAPESMISSLESILEEEKPEKVRPVNINSANPGAYT